MADRTGHSGSIVELMRGITDREFKARMAWLADEIERPSRADWYAMQIAMEVKRSRVKHPNLVTLKEMVLEREQPKSPLTKEEATTKSKSFWYGMVGIQRKQPPNG